MASTSTNRRQGINTGAAVKVACKAATTANITLSGEQTIDGIACTDGDRVFVMEQDTASENGIYEVSTSTWQRAKDFDGTFDVVEGTLIPVSRGTTNGGQVFRVTNTGTITIGTTSLTFTWALDAASMLFTQSGSGATSRTVQAKLRDIYSVKDFGVAADDTDESTEIQAAIDAVSAAGGGVLMFPAGTYKGNVTLKQGVFLVGSLGFGYIAGFSTATQVKFTAASTGVAIDTPVTEIAVCGVIGMNVQGLGAGTACKGIRFRYVNRGIVKAVSFNSFTDEGLLVDSDSGACVFEDLFAVNCLLDRSQAAKIGAIDIDGTDHFISRIESTASQSALSDANAYLCGFLIRGDTCTLDSVIGELSDEGIHVASGATYNRFVNCRADLNFGHGFNITGDLNQFSNCLSLNNGQETTNTYDGFIIPSGAERNQFSNCKAESTTAKVHRYGFNDGVASATAFNTHVNPVSRGHGTAAFINQTSAGSAFGFPSGGEKTLTANSATPDVTGWERFITANTNPTTITNFTGGVCGQLITVTCNDDNTTIQHNGSTIVLGGLGSKKLRQRSTYQFVKSTSGLWREVENLGVGCTADVGDAAKTLQARVDSETQIWATTLTADRAVSLSTTGAYAGAKFHIARPAAGAFNLNVGTGPLKALAADTWCEVTYDGSAWALTKYGAL
jgi:hypothetical protein